MLHTKDTFLSKQYYTFTTQGELCCWFVSRGALLIYRACYTLGWVGWFYFAVFIYIMYIYSVLALHVLDGVGFTASPTIHTTYNSYVYSTLNLLKVQCDHYHDCWSVVVVTRCTPYI